MATITIRQLIRAGACPEQRATFRALFGASVEVTEELATQHAREFSWDWAAENLLPAPARKAYERARATAREACEQAVATAREAYERAMATTQEACDQRITVREAVVRAITVREAVVRAMATAREAYERAMAIAFAQLYIQHCDKDCAA